MEKIREMPGRVNAALRAAGIAAAKIPKEPVRAIHEAALSDLNRAADEWETKAYGEIRQGTRTPESWLAWGEDLERSAQDAAKRATDAQGLLGRLAGWFGGSVSAAFDALEAAVRDRRKDLDRLTKEAEALEATRKTLAGRTLPTDVATLINGAPYQAARNNLARLREIVTALESGISAVKGGRLKAVKKGDDIAFEGLTDAGAVMLGALPAIAGGTALAIVAVAAGLAVSLSAYFRRATEATRIELEKAELALVAQGKGAEVIAVKQLRNEAEQIRNETGTVGTVSKTLRFVVGAALVAGAGVLGWKVYEAHQGKRRSNPRRRRKRVTA